MRTFCGASAQSVQLKVMGDFEVGVCVCMFVRSESKRMSEKLYVDSFVDIYVLIGLIIFG